MRFYAEWDEVEVPAWRSVPVRQNAPDPTIIIVDGEEVTIVKHRRWIHVPLADGWYRVEMRWAMLFTWRARFTTVRGRQDVCEWWYDDRVPPHCWMSGCGWSQVLEPVTRSLCPQCRKLIRKDHSR